MKSSEIKKISEKNIELNNLINIKNILEKNYIIEHKKLSPQELRTAINNEHPFYIKNNFIIGYEKGVFINDKDENIEIERDVYAVVMKGCLNSEQSQDNFMILGSVNWDNKDISDFMSVIGNLKVGAIYLPPHSAIFNFLKPTEKETKEKIVSSLMGVNINIYSRDNYIDNALHEIGHLFWRDCLKLEEKKKFEKHFETLQPSAIYEYDWEKSDVEEMFVTIYKWYVKSFLINKSFMNILKHEEPKGLELIQDVMTRISKDKMVDEIWDMQQFNINSYLKPRVDGRGRRIMKQGLREKVESIEIPDRILNDVNKFENGRMFVNLNKGIVPINGNKIDVYSKLEKAKSDKKQTIYVDMDGVVVDIAKAYKQAFNRNIYNDDSFNVSQFVKQVPHFFAMLEPIQKGVNLVDVLKAKYNVVFLTTPMDMEYCKIDKINWIKENFGDFDVLFSDNKADYVVDSSSILIDDMSHNLDSWKESGGTAISYPQKLDVILDTIEETLTGKSDIKRIKKEIDSMVVNTEPTEKQKESGIYRKGRVNFKGIDLVIENPKGSIRFGFNEQGKKWVTKLKNHYGYIAKTEGADYDEIDFFLGDKLNGSRVFVVNQKKKDNSFDEIKVIFGANDIDEAEQIYLSNYQKGWDGLMSIVPTNTKKFRNWLENGNKFEPF